MQVSSQGLLLDKTYHLIAGTNHKHKERNSIIAAYTMLVLVRLSRSDAKFLVLLLLLLLLRCHGSVGRAEILEFGDYQGT